MEINLEILPSGEIAFLRPINQNENIELLDFLSELTEATKIKEFMDGAKKIQLIIGDEIYCG